MKTLITFAAVALMAVTTLAQQSQQQKRSLTQADYLQIAVQKICPVSGEALGAMGDPIKETFGDELKEMLGHTPREVISGVIWGLIVAIASYYLIN